MADILSFPVRKPAKPKPDTARLGYDFNQWCVEYFAGGRFLRRTYCVSQVEASQLIDSLVRHHGLNWLPDTKPWGGAA